jgi:hypothetical protein
MRETSLSQLMFVTKTYFNNGVLRVVSLLTLCAAPLLAETSLERVLSIAGANASPEFDQILLNLTRNNIENAQLNIITTIDGSIKINVSSTKTLRNSHGEAPNDLDDPTHVPFNIDLKTSAMGASNTGVINTTIKPGLDGTNMLVVNAATDSGNLLANVIILSETSAIMNANTISTSAIGAINTGTIEVVIDQN